MRKCIEVFFNPIITLKHFQQLKTLIKKMYVCKLVLFKNSQEESAHHLLGVKFLLFLFLYLTVWMENEILNLI